MNNKLMKLTAIILMVFMLPVFSAFAEDSSQLPSQDPALSPEDSPELPADYLNAIKAYYDENPTLTSWWDVVALYGAGADLSDYTLPEWTTETLGEFASVTDYAGIIFGLTAMGENVHNVWGRDIADELAKMQDSQSGLFGSYPNQQIYSILALDVAREPYNRDLAISALIDTFRTEEGAFGYLPFDPSAPQIATPDIDITALALLVLDETSHADIISSSVSYLAVQQLENGGFESWGTENSNTLESVIFALSTLGLLEDERFVKNDLSLSEVLSSYILESGMLTWEAGSSDENLMATQQGLIAYGDIIAGKSVFLRLSSSEVCSTITANVRIEGSASNVLNTSVTIKGYNLNIVDAVKKALDLNSVPYLIEDSEYGAYIRSINSEAAGKFGGWDGWLVALNGNELSESADAYTLSENDEILVYYGMFSPGTLIPSYALSTTAFTQNSPFTITVTGTYYDYTTSQNVTVAIAGATVEVGGIKYTTDENGIATIIPSVAGTHTVKIYKDNQGSYPSIVRTVPFDISVTATYHGGGGGSSYRPSKTPDTTEKDKTETTTPAEENESEEKEDPADTEEENITDVPLTYNDTAEISDWAVDGVKKAVGAGLFVGDENGNFNPTDSLNRAELATILIRLTNPEEKDAKDAGFTDVNVDDWYYDAVCSVYSLGFMTGTGISSFAPMQTVTREQAAVVLTRILKLDTDKTYNYSDSGEISDWAVNAVNALTEAKIMEGEVDGFNPKAILTREMCAVIMVRALEYQAAK